MHVRTCLCWSAHVRKYTDRCTGLFALVYTSTICEDSLNHTCKSLDPFLLPLEF